MDMEMNAMENSNLERRMMEVDLSDTKEAIEMGFLAFGGLRARHNHLAKISMVPEGSGFEGSAALEAKFDGSGVEGSGLEGSGAEDASFEGSGAEGSGAEGSGIEGSGLPEDQSHMEGSGELLLPPEPMLEIVTSYSPDISPPELSYVDPVQYDGASYPYLPLVAVPDTAGETAPHVVYPAPVSSWDLSPAADTAEYK